MRSSALQFLSLISATALVAQTPKEVIPVGGSPNPNLSTVVKAGELLYLSGQLGTGQGGLVPGGIKAETQKTLENIKRVVEAAGSTMERIVKCTVFLVDIGEFGQMNEVYRTFWPKDPPARSTVAVAGLVLNARIEIECIGLAGK
jgi:2-iminobutanoate/2-iminopropanoate deaminase